MSIDSPPQPVTRAPRTFRQRRLVAVGWAVLLAPGALWALVRLTGLDLGPAVQLLAFTPYVAGGSLLPLVLAVAGTWRSPTWRHRWPVAVAALTALALLGAVLPRAVPGAEPPGGGVGLRVLTSNVLYGGADPAGIVDLVRAQRVDVLAVQEFTAEIEAGLDRAGLGTLLPYRITNPRVGAGGSALYSRFPLRDTGVRQNVGSFTQAYGTLTAPGAVPVRVESVHPCAPANLGQLDCWRADLADQPPATGDGELRVLAGDFNATLDHERLRALLDTGYVDAAAAVGRGLTGTWGPYDGDRIPPVVLDHVLVDERIAVLDASVHAVRGSDHRAVLAEVSVPAAG